MMKPSLAKVVKNLLLYTALTAFIPVTAFADSHPVDSRHDGFSRSRTIVVCDFGTDDCNARTAASDIEDALVINDAFPLPGGKDAPSFTLLSGSSLTAFLESGYSGNTVFIDANSDGTATYHGITFSLTAAPTAVPEPASLALLAIGLAGLAVAMRRRNSAA